MAKRMDHFWITVTLAIILFGVGWLSLMLYVDRQMDKAISSDGRYHLCGLVTEQGVTEHLDAYAKRCGNKGRN